MMPSKGSSSFSNHRGRRHNGGYNCSGFRDGDISILDKVTITNRQHPKCLCDLYTIISISRTHKNLDRLFFGCPLYKEKLSHYKFFAWVVKFFTST
ncbi:hypothetical protein Ahy_A05g024612 [Arachis hypogaea]|uniref:Uncharacterized protein n=1 Tax=Arachis hypogaea TaxID=3818 RepID=A0A445D6V0_ARAHY|nr:hypothetical protein Ahy_A05g024612 [Arachis hypogaea]